MYIYVMKEWYANAVFLQKEFLLKIDCDVSYHDQVCSLAILDHSAMKNHSTQYYTYAIDITISQGFF